VKRFSVKICQVQYCRNIFDRLLTQTYG